MNNDDISRMLTTDAYKPTIIDGMNFPKVLNRADADPGPQSPQSLAFEMASMAKQALATRSQEVAFPDPRTVEAVVAWLRNDAHAAWGRSNEWTSELVWAALAIERGDPFTTQESSNAP